MLKAIAMAALGGWLLLGAAFPAAAAGTGTQGVRTGTGQAVHAASASSGTVKSGSEGRAEAERQARLLEQAAEKVYTQALEGNLAVTRQSVEELSNLFVSSSFEGLTSVEGVNALSGAIVDMKAAANAAQAEPGRLQSAAAKLRLAANALAHTRDPVWMQYYKLMTDDLGKLEKAASARDMKGWTGAMHRLDANYETIRSAMAVSLPPEQINALQAWLSYARNIPATGQPPERQRLLEIVSFGRDSLRVAFGREKDEPTLTLPMAPQGFGPWGLLAGGFMFTALAYFVYRKYRGESKEWKAV